MPDKIDIMMTAVLRPKIFNETLSTIVKNVVDIAVQFSFLFFIKLYIDIKNYLCNKSRSYNFLIAP